MAEDKDHTHEHSLASAPKHQPLSCNALRWRCDPNALGFASTADVEPVVGVIGQDTAVEALRFGLEIDAPGQNVFVRGLTGTGRMTLVSRMLEERHLECPLASDRCYVHHFTQPDRPRLITLPRGQARAFRQRVDELADFIRDRLDNALASEGVQTRVAALEQKTQKRIKQIVEPLEKSLREAGLGLVTVQADAVAQAALFPLLEGKPVPPEEWEQRCAGGEITEDQADEFRRQHEAFQPQLRTTMRDVSEIRRQYLRAVHSLREQVARLILREFVESIAEEFADPAVRVFLDELVDDVVKRRAHGSDLKNNDTHKYRVNVLICRSEDRSCAIVVENTPTLGNLLGTVDQKLEQSGPGLSDHMMVRAGALLRADGGYLILDARDLLREPAAWKVLVRTLRTGRLEIIPPEMAFPWGAPSLKPEPIDLKVKVILLGDAETYYLLDAYDPDFPHLFKVLADFGSVIDLGDEGIAQYGGVLARIVQDEDLLHFASTAVAALVEHGARIASRNDRLTTRFGRLADIAREACYLARKAGRSLVRGEEVKQAIRRAKTRADLPSKRFRELQADGTIRVAITGSAVGQVNGLAVIHAGPLTYGFPTRITATIGPGSSGVINIEREAQLSGAIHTKGFYILGGLLRHLLRTDHPLAFHASVAFEQTYGGIDGDSASAAESCCLLSALTDLPLRQDIALTGAIDQVGNILAVGAVNEKIEGFFEVCRDGGLPGGQGVIIPQANARDLMLRDDVVDACREGRFCVYTVDTIHEALEILTGVQAGQPGDQGRYPEDSLLGVAKLRAFEYWLKASPNVEAFTVETDETDDTEKTASQEDPKQ